MVFSVMTGLEASVADDEALISVKNAKIAVESQDAEKIHVFSQNCFLFINFSSSKFIISF